MGNGPNGGPLSPPATIQDKDCMHCPERNSSSSSSEGEQEQKGQAERMQAELNNRAPAARGVKRPLLAVTSFDMWRGLEARRNPARGREVTPCRVSRVTQREGAMSWSFAPPPARGAPVARLPFRRRRCTVHRGIREV